MIPGGVFRGLFFRNDEVLCLLTFGHDVGEHGFEPTVTTKTFKLPESLRGRAFSFGERGDGKLLIIVSNETAARGDTTTVQTFSLTEDGSVGSPQEATIPLVHDSPRRLRWPAVAVLASPLALWLQGQTPGRSSVFGSGLLAVVYLVSAAAAVLCFWRESRY